MNLPIQVRPVESRVIPSGHTHMNEPSLFTHVPPPLHCPGNLVHSLMSTGKDYILSNYIILLHHISITFNQFSLEINVL